ncbi:MAG: cyclic nucleotide-binding domain-containing protein [Acidobacteriota bacterium]|jgi:CRP/FNR family cyclic AMP-dependent transcriptional regulator
MSDQIPFQPLLCSSSLKARLTALQRAEILRGVEIFSRATVEDLILLSTISCEIQLNAGEKIFAEGEIADALYIIVEGKVELRGSAISGLLGPYEAFGIYAVLSNEPRYASARALEDTFALKIRAHDFFDLISQNAEILQSLFKLLIEKLTSNEKN